MPLKPSDSYEILCCVDNKVKRLSAQSRNKELGEKLVVKQQLELAPFKAVPFSGWGDWEQDPLNNRSWQWRLNWLSFLSYLMAYHHASGDEAVLDSAREAIQSWLDAYLETDTSYPFEFIWHDHATALRAEQLVLFAYYCREHAPEWVSKHAEFLTYLEQALVVHGQWLAKDSFYSEHTNHGLEQARVLLLLGTVFEGEQAREWQQIAIRRISSELTFAFTDEGVHVENSPAYHIFVFKVFLGIIKDYPEEVLGDLAEQFSQFSAKALSFITHILRPDGKLPPIGDTEQLPTSDAYRDMFGHRLEYQHFLYALTQGKQGIRPPVLNRVYPKSGYAIFRDQWPAKEHYQKAFHLIAKVGCSSRYHHQQDEGHISLYAGGEDWLIDSGLYNYINKDPVRKYMRGRPGHNVPIISHASYAKEFQHRLSAWQVTDHSEAAPAPQLTMRLDVLPPVVHERKVAFDAAAKVLKVEDTVSADDGQQRNVTFQWHFPKDKMLTIEDSQVVVISPTGSRLTIEFEGEIPDNLSVAKGREGDKVFSCISYKANQVESSQVLRVMFKERRGLNVTTRFRFAMAEDKVAPASEKADIPEFPLATLLGTSRQVDPVTQSVMIGSSPAYLALVRSHREQMIGHVSLLVNDSADCKQAQAQLKEHYLTTWLSCRPLTSTPLITADKAALKGLEGIGRLVITPTGFTEKRLATVLLTMLPPLFKRMTKTGEVWISTDLPDSLKALCTTWAKRRGLAVNVVTGLGAAMEVSHD
ncbi:heparinase II/III family protein [Orrella marina]|uniref:Uncharacterized protein n=1 Tax=Orrella marina TaxID=2163011 RepID=A0A2R4XFQ5_9BURK|nr:heparinase II/III family protein [Orrella marina]AWB32569.1 hypothetical protein DBV39_01265 [Orrella marina]